MEYVSTRNNSLTHSFEDVFIRGLAEDGGLYVPKELFKFENQELKKLEKLDYQNLATEIIQKFIGDFMSKEDLSKIINKSYKTFRSDQIIEFKKIDKYTFLELFHGPTLAFKDIALQLIGNFYEYYLSRNNKKINIIVATSGDTGAAAIHALKGKQNVNIFVLHPNNKISPVQRRIMTTFEDDNIFNLAVKGNFDDCQNIVKSLFSDLNFSKEINMSGVNSINWARIIAQSVYYFYCYFRLEDKKEVNFSVPTGNFGDIYAGYLAKKIGLPINKLIVATNKNDILHRAISSGDYTAQKVSETYSPSMDIQIASNFERLIYDLSGSDSKETLNIMEKIKKNNFEMDKKTLDKIKINFLSERLNEKETLENIKEIYNKNNYIIDPHTAIGVGAAKKLNFESCVVLATAHPSKFPSAIKDSINKDQDLPDELSYIFNKKEKYYVTENNIDEIKKYIKKKIDDKN